MIQNCVQIRIHIHTGDNPNAFDDSMRIATVLASHQFDLMRIILVGYRIVEDQKSCGCLDDLAFDIFPSQFGWQTFSCQVAIESIMAKLLAMFGKVRQGVIDLTDQEKDTGSNPVG